MIPLGNALSAISSLIPVATGIYFFKRLNTGRKRMLYFFILTAYVELSNIWLVINKIDPVVQQNIYMLVEFSFFILVFCNWIKGKVSLLLCSFCFVLFLTFWLFHFIHDKGLKNFAESAGIVESVLITLWAVYILVVLSIYTESPMIRNYKFWFAASTVIYFSVNSLLDYLLALLRNGYPGYSFELWDLHSTVNIINNVLYAYVFFLRDE